MCKCELMMHKDNYVGFYQFIGLIEKKKMNEIESECLDFSFTFLYMHII